MIRSIFLNIFIGINTILFCIWSLVVVYLLRRRDKETFHLVEVPWARSILKACGIKGKVKGAEKLAKNRAYIFMCNHQSIFDIFILTANIPVPFKFIVKKELMKIFPMGNAMKLVGHVGIDRKSPKRAMEALKLAKEKLKNGTSFLVFPEGTRSNDGRLKAFKKGAFLLALESGSEIVPLAIKGSNRIVPKGSLRINRAFFELNIGTPIQVKSHGRKELPTLMDKVRSSILHMLS